MLVVAQRVLDQVLDEALEESPVAAHQRRFEVEIEGKLERVGFGSQPVDDPGRQVGEVDGLLGHGGSTGAGQREQPVDEGLAADRGVSHHLGHRAEIRGRGPGIGEGNVDLGADDRQRGPQLVGGVGHEALLAHEGPVEPFEHGVERVGQLLELVGWSRQADALVEVDVRETLRGGRDGVDGTQHAPGDHPADPDRSHGQHRDAMPDSTSIRCRLSLVNSRCTSRKSARRACTPGGPDVPDTRGNVRRTFGFRPRRRATAARASDGLLFTLWRTRRYVVPSRMLPAKISTAPMSSARRSRMVRPRRGAVTGSGTRRRRPWR